MATVTIYAALRLPQDPVSRVTLEPLNAAMDAGLGIRVAAHEARSEKKIGVPDYLSLLKLVRRMEDVIEPVRRSLGATSSRAFEISVEMAPVRYTVEAVRA